MSVASASSVATLWLDDEPSHDATSGAVDKSRTSSSIVSLRSILGILIAAGQSRAYSRRSPRSL